MKSHHLFFAALLMLGLSASVWAQSSLDTYETHNWEVSFGPVVVDGSSATHVDSGTEALQVTYTPGSAGWDVAAIDTDEFLTEVGTGLTTGMTVRAYLEVVSGVGTPTVKVETTQDDNGAQGGADTFLTADAWTTITLPSGNMTEDYKRGVLVFANDGGATNGTFRIWLDNMQREGAVWDDFESADNTSVKPSNIDGTFRGERTLGGSTLATAGPAPTQGSHAWGMTWAGDGDGTVEIQHNYSSLDLSTQNRLDIDVYVPSGTSLPTINLFFVDGLAAGSFVGGSAVSANDAWETISIDITAVHGAIDSSDIVEVKIIAASAGASGTLFVDNGLTEVPVELSVFSSN